MRTLSSQLADEAGKTVTLQGWLHKKRKLGGLNFLLLRDRGGTAQILVDDEKEMEKLRGLQVGTIIEVTGLVEKDDRAPGGYEIHKPKLNVEVAVSQEPPIEIDKPLSHKGDNLDTLFDHRPIVLRNLKEQAIFKVQAKVLEAFRVYFQNNNLTEIKTPKLLAEATEGGTETFKLDYFDKTATLAQSPQFYKQIMVGVFERVFEIAPVYRAEPSATTRHMTEYVSIDVEIGFIELNELLNFAGGALLFVANTISKECKNELKQWNAKPFVLPKKPENIPRISIDEIHEKFYKATKEDHRQEDDLAPSEERWVCEWSENTHKSEAVLVTGWSSKSKTFKFYHKANEKNPELADRADLLFRGVEISTLSMRENKYETLIEQLKSAGGDPENPGYQPLLSAYLYGMPMHGGFGWGLERTVEKLIGLDNVKEATLFPRDIQRLSP